MDPSNPLRQFIRHNDPEVEELEAPDDCVEYHIFLADGEKDLDKALIEINQFISNWINEYLWHDETFLLKKFDFEELKGPMKGAPFHLYGKTIFGDNLEDEWFIVFLLQQITKKFEGTTVYTFDSDGQYLLIEAADHIPKWLQPKNSENRIFLHNGDLHIIPIAQKPSELELLGGSSKSWAIADALQLIRKNPEIQTKASDKAQITIQNKTSKYPASITDGALFHRTNVDLPRPLAWMLLGSSPKYLHFSSKQLLAASVKAFMYRDLIDMKNCLSMNRFGKSVSGAFLHDTEQKCTVSVRFTRHLYAQLISQKFYPPKSFGNPPNSHSPAFKPFDLSVKLLCGLEILYQNAKKRKEQLEKRKSKPEIESDDHVLWFETLEALFQQYESSNLEKIDQELAVFQHKQSESDSWLEMSPSDLDQILSSLNPNKSETEKAQHVDDTLEKFKTFLNRESGVEGVELEEEDGHDNDDDVMKEEDDEFSDEDFGEEEGDFGDEDIEEIKELMKQMDSELSQNPMFAHDFDRMKKNGNVEDMPWELDSDDEDFNLAKNIMEASASQVDGGVLNSPFTTLLSHLASKRSGKK